MSTTSTTTTSYEVAREDFRAIQLGPVGFPTLARVRSAGHTIRPIDEQSIRNRDSTQPLTSDTFPKLSKWQTTVIVVTVSCTTFLNTMLSGILVVSLPTMARDVHLSEGLLLWPASVNALACGCTLLVAGSIADVIGGRKIYLVGTFALTITTIACGSATSGIQLIVFRAAQGLAVSLCMPSSVILITRNIAIGEARNFAFACMGAGQPVGFSMGLVLGGIFVDGIGWRWGYYIGAIITFIVFVVCIFGVPADPKVENSNWKITTKRLWTEIDWVGCLLLSASLGLLSYALAVLTSGISRFLAPATIALFCIAILLILAFAFHTQRQEKLGRKVIIPPSLWKNTIFASLCIAIFFTWGAMYAVQYFFTLFLQEIQSLSALQTSLRFLPCVFTGVATNIATGFLVPRVRADLLIWAACMITGVSPLMMAIINPAWSYWVCAFFAMVCMPVCSDTLFTVANLVITSIFQPGKHGLAGGVFNTVANLGNSVCLALTAVVAGSVTIKTDGTTQLPSMELDTGRYTLMEGYRATFWFCFGANLLVLCISMLGLRKIGKVGIKAD